MRSDLAAYYRLSDDDREQDESNSIKSQRLLVQQYITDSEEFRGREVKEYIDDGFTGTNFGRPGFQALMNGIQSGAITCVIVKDLSRFGRDPIEAQEYVEKVLPFLQVRFIAINDGYDSSEAVTVRKDTEVKFKNLVNGIYPEICSENVKQALRKRAEAGKVFGSIPPFGYDFKGEDRSVLVLDDEEAAIVRRIFDYRLQGSSYTDIARKLNAEDVETPSMCKTRKGYKLQLCVETWGRKMISNMLSNPVYTGAVVNNKTTRTVISTRHATKNAKEDWICVENMHEPIVTKEEFEKVLAMIRHQQDKPGVKVKKPVGVLSGKVRCGHCGYAVRNRNEGKTATLICRNAHLDGKKGCYSKSSSMVTVEDTVLEMIRHQALIAEDIRKKVEKINADSDKGQMEKQLHGYEIVLDKMKQEAMEWYEQFALGRVDKEEFIRVKKQKSNETAELEHKVNQLKGKIAEATKQENKKNSSYIKSFGSYKNIQGLSREMVLELIDKIYYYDPTHIEIQWNFQDEYEALCESINIGRK